MTVLEYYRHVRKCGRFPAHMALAMARKHAKG